MNEWVWCLTSQSSRQQRVETGGGQWGERVALSECAAAPVGARAHAHLVDTLRFSERRQAQSPREARQGIAALGQAGALEQGLRGAPREGRTAQGLCDWGFRSSATQRVTV